MKEEQVLWRLLIVFTVPEQTPLQPAKVESEVGVAVRVIVVPLANVSE